MLWRVSQTNSLQLMCQRSSAGIPAGVRRVSCIRIRTWPFLMSSLRPWSKKSEVLTLLASASSHSRASCQPSPAFWWSVVAGGMSLGLSRTKALMNLLLEEWNVQCFSLWMRGNDASLFLVGFLALPSSTFRARDAKLSALKLLGGPGREKNTFLERRPSLAMIQL